MRFTRLLGGWNRIWATPDRVQFGMLPGLVFGLAFLSSQGMANGDFRSGLDAWQVVSYGAKPSVAVDPAVNHAGSRSLEVSSDEPSDTALGQEVSLRPSGWYELSGWVRTRGLDPHGAPVYGTLQAQGTAGSSVLAGGENHGGDTEWTQVKVYFLAPATGMVRISAFYCGWGRGTGKAWFSDLKLEEIHPEEVPMIITRQPMHAEPISRLQYGQFIEYLCTLVPGMWAEKLYDTSFEGLTPYKFVFIKETDDQEKPWYPCGEVNRSEVSRDDKTKVTGTYSMRIEALPGAPCTVGIAQDGVAVEAGQELKFSVDAKGTCASQKIRIRLHEGSRELGAAEVPLASDWTKERVSLTPSGTSDKATFSIEFRGPGTVWLDNASLMPAETVGGWRPDVVKALTALKPGVIRIGGSVLDDPNLGHFEWQQTIGPVESRVPFEAWGGLQPIGAGLEEVVQLIRDCGAEPLICVRFTGKTPKDAADEVEYFNGGADTPMGALRAKNGHPAPYHIKYWQVGNERSGGTYETELPEFCRAMLAVDPKIELLSSFPTPGVLQNAGQYLSFTCPHQYDVNDLSGTAAELDDVREMIAKYAPGRKIKVGVTEWNTTAGDAGPRRAMLWSLANALACSRYQNLMHRNSDLVEIANRSNLTNSFCSGIIQTNRSGMYLTPTYYAQELYSNLAGDVELRVDSDLRADMAPDVSATLSADGKTLTIFAVNDSLEAIRRPVDLSAFVQGAADLEVWTLGDTFKRGEPDAANSFETPERIVPVKSRVHEGASRFEYEFPPLTLSVLRVSTGR